jgi:hypothetical protein
MAKSIFALNRPLTPQELTERRRTLVRLGLAWLAMMQVMMPPGAGMPPMAPPPPGGALPMDPSMMGLPPTPPPGMVAQASFDGDNATVDLVRAAMDFLR